MSAIVYNVPENMNLEVPVFYDHMTVHHNRFLMNKTNKCTEFQFYWYYYSTCFGQLFCPSSGVLGRTSALVHFMQLWPFATRSRMELLFHPTPDSKWSQLHKMYQSRCTAKNSWWWAERLPETRRVVVHFMQLWPFATSSRKELLFHPIPGSKWSQLDRMYQSRCTGKNSWWWAVRLPETCKSSDINKTGIQCICWFYSQGIWSTSLLG